MLRFKKNNAVDFPNLEETTLGEVCNKIGDGLHSAPTYDVDGEYYFINGNNLKDGTIMITSDTKKVSKETFLKNDKGLDGHTILLSINGTIGNLAYYKNENVMLGKSAAYLKIKESVDKEYIYQLLQTRKVKTSFLLSLTGTTIKNLGLEAINKTHIFIPVLEEQHKIADFLSSVDEIIQVQEEEISTLEEQKKGAMQKIFNREVRFKADDGSEYPEWEERTFDEIFDVIQNNTFSRDCLNNDSGEVVNIHYGDVLIKYGAFIDVGKEKVPHINADIQLNKFDEKSFLRNGDIIIADTAEDMTVGKATEICGAIGKRILSGLHTIPCRPKMFFVSKYLGYYINSEKYHNQLMPLIQGIKVSSISKSNISKTKIIYPCAEEQEKIVDCLSAYDEAIQIKKDKLEVWKEIKKGLLQQMFV